MWLNVNKKPFCLPIVNGALLKDLVDVQRLTFTPPDAKQGPNLRHGVLPSDSDRLDITSMSVTNTFPRGKIQAQKFRQIKARYKKFLFFFSGVHPALVLIQTWSSPSGKNTSKSAVQAVKWTIRTKYIKGEEGESPQVLRWLMAQPPSKAWKSSLLWWTTTAAWIITERLHYYEMLCCCRRNRRQITPTTRNVWLFVKHLLPRHRRHFQRSLQHPIR